MGSKRNRITLASQLLMLIGIGLLIYMVRVEGEPGAVPLLLILMGAGGWFLSSRNNRR